MGVTFAALRILGNIYVLKEILANNEMGLLGSFLSSFDKLCVLPAVPNASLTFSELIIEVTSSLSVGLNVKVSSTGSER